MVVSVSANLHSEASTDKTRAIIQTDAFSAEKLDLKIQLGEVLQTSLDLNMLLKLFLEKVSTVVRLDGIHYSNEDLGIEASIAKQATHSCGYRLITSEDKLGEVIFKRGKKFTEKELSILETLLSTLIYPLRNALRFSMAVRSAFMDPLTGAGNSRFLPQTLDREIDLAKRHNQPLSVLMVEVDGFRKLLDQHGLGNAERVLRELAANLSQWSRTTDAVFRNNGDQFMLILSNTDKVGANVIARRIQEGAAAMCSVAADNSTGVTESLSLSQGLAVMTGTDSSTSLLERAAKALASARKRGGNLIHN
jgi:diguanylate cyclase (GGDEF)-like protein